MSDIRNEHAYPVTVESKLQSAGGHNFSQTSMDDATQLLQLAARLHTARGNQQVWRDVLLSFRDGFNCTSVHNLLPEVSALGADALSALAGRMSHCASYGEECSHNTALHRQRCAAFATHLHIAALAGHKALQAALFDYLPATWVVDLSAAVCEANTAAKSLAQTGERVVIVGQRLELPGPNGARTMLNAVSKVATQSRLAWKTPSGQDVNFLLRVLPDTVHIAVTALPDAPSPAEQAPVLAEQLGLTPRQSELAAHLLADHTLASAARAMGISRHTANEHLTALLQRAGALNRKALLIILRSMAQR